MELEAGCESPILLSKFPWRRLSRAFCTVGSLSSGDGVTVAVPVTDDADGVAVVDAGNTIY